MHLISLRATAEACTRDLTGPLFGLLVELDSAITYWLDVVFLATRRKLPNTFLFCSQPTPPPPVAFKKAQDLYHRDSTLLAEKIVTRQLRLEEEVVPVFSDVKTLYEGIFSACSPTNIEPIDDPKASDLVYHPIRKDKIISLTKNWSNSS